LVQIFFGALETFKHCTMMSILALARVNVTGEIAITIADEVRSTRAPLVPQIIVQGASDVAQNPLDCLLVLYRRSFHE
jgi:hypothetical protein